MKDFTKKRHLRGNKHLRNHISTYLESTYCFSFKNVVQPPTISFNHRAFQEDFWTQPEITKFQVTKTTYRVLTVS